MRIYKNMPVAVKGLIIIIIACVQDQSSRRLNFNEKNNTHTYTYDQFAISIV